MALLSYPEDDDGCSILSQENGGGGGGGCTGPVAVGGSASPSSPGGEGEVSATASSVAAATGTGDGGSGSGGRAAPLRRKPKTLAILGTGSDVGKTWIACGLCRILSREGYRVAPFKAQNMSNNASPALIVTGGGRRAAEKEKSPTRREPVPPDAPPAGAVDTATGSTDDVDDGNCDGPSSGDEGDRWGEIGTAQALQAQACGLVPRVEMNPILLKSGGRRRSDGAYLCSVIVRGRHHAEVDYGFLAGPRTSGLQELVLEAHADLCNLTNAEYVVAEGAGSCTELNFADRDVVNLPLVRQLRCPWLLVADIDRGGVFAQILGTVACLSSTDDWEDCCGVVVNRLRGDPKFFESGVQIIQERVGKPVFVVPWLYGLNLPEEDGVGIETRLRQERNLLSQRMGSNGDKPVVVVVAYPYVSIDSDIVPLERDPDVIVEWRRDVLPLPYPETHAVVLPGSRITRADLHWVESRGWGDFIRDHVRRGGVVVGLCGGYQMLGQVVRDDDGIEGEPGTSTGLGLLPVETAIEPTPRKVVRPRSAELNGLAVPVSGFELHCGRTTFITGYNDGRDEATTAEPLLRMVDRKADDGEVAATGLRLGKVSGSYLHGIFDSKHARSVLLHLPPKPPRSSEVEGSNCVVQPDDLDKLADHLESAGLVAEIVVRMFSGSPSS